MEDINPDTLKTAASLLRKRALELCSLEDDTELREIFEPFGGIETGIKFFTLLNGQVDAYRQLFQSIDTNFLHSNTESVQVDLKANDIYFKTYNR
jgi:hypothetical protein